MLSWMMLIALLRTSPSQCWIFSASSCFCAIVTSVRAGAPPSSLSSLRFLPDALPPPLAFLAGPLADDCFLGLDDPEAPPPPAPPLPDAEGLGGLGAFGLVGATEEAPPTALLETAPWPADDFLTFFFGPLEALRAMAASLRFCSLAMSALIDAISAASRGDGGHQSRSLGRPDMPRSDSPSSALSTSYSLSLSTGSAGGGGIAFHRPCQ